jgi:hypothetical protein
MNWAFSGTGGDPLARALEHARWFVEAHYAPFPVSFDEGLQAFARGLDLEAVVRLSPVFFRTQAFELEQGDARERVLHGAFSSEFAPEPEGVLSRLRQELESALVALAEQYRSPASAPRVSATRPGRYRDTGVATLR